MRVSTLPNSKPVLRVFLSSPGDLGAQRDVARQVIGAMNADPLVSPAFVVEVVGWDTPGARVPLSANETPQASVNEFLPRPRHCDLTIVMLWGRLGTPLPHDWTDGPSQTRLSGTVWELDDALSARKPVWIYRKSGAPQVRIDDPDIQAKRAQLDAVNHFLANQCAADGSLRFGLHTFDDDEQFRDLLTEHLRHFIGKLLHSRANASVSIEGGVSDGLSSNALVLAAAEVAASESMVESMGAETASLPVLRAIKDYPVGPMIKDVVVGALATAIAELTEGSHPRNTLSRINELLVSAAEKDTPPIRVVHVMFPSTLGSVYFWEEVLHWAAVQGPRVLAATLSVFDALQLEGQALVEYKKLLGRLNRYD
jgi:hypothetical protein